jgi:hypothetical protein
MAADGTERDQQKTTEGNRQVRPIFTEKGFEHISAYLNTLKCIHIRLVIEGYRIVDGKVAPPRQRDKTESE